MKVINKNSKTTLEPSVNEMEYGEIAVNYNATDPRLLIKDSANKIIGFPSETKVNNQFDVINNTISGLTKNVSNNQGDIEALESWIVTPLTTAEIESAFV